MNDTDPDSTLLCLIAGLCLEAGRIMEDTSPDLALALPVDQAGVTKRLKQLRRAAEDILVLATAARSLHGRVLAGYGED